MKQVWRQDGCGFAVSALILLGVVAALGLVALGWSGGGR